MTHPAPSTTHEETLWGLEPGDETKALCWRKRHATTPTPWEGRLPKEPSEDVRIRHDQARIQCHLCPLLNACERALTAMEKRALRVDGVMAGRYSDVYPYSHVDNEFTQTTCRGCHAQLKPQGPVSNNRKSPKEARNHQGEGLCDKCYPKLARAIRHQPTKRNYQLNNPTTTA